MKKLPIAIVLLLVSLPSHAWFFFFIPGGVTRAIGDAVTGARGNICVREGTQAGQTINSPTGNTAKVLSVSGTSSICRDPRLPIRAELEFTFAFSSKAGINLPDDMEPQSLSDLERFNGYLLKARSKTVANAGIVITAIARKPSSDIQTAANNVERSMLNNQAVKEVKSQNSEKLTINGMAAVRFELVAQLKGVFGPTVTYLYTILEGDNEIAVVNAYAPRDYFEAHKVELKSHAENISGIKAPAAAPAIADSSAPEKPIELSAEERLGRLNKLLNDGLISQEDFDTKKQEILRGL